MTSKRKPTDQPARDARHRVRRQPDRAHYDRAYAYEVLDAGMVAHVGFVVNGQPFVIPMLYARDGDTLLLHGAVASRLMGTLAEGVPCCAEVTHIDGLVLARSHFHHSMNYRSVVAFGRAHLVAGAKEKRAALALYVDKLIPGRAADSRAPNAKELAATSVLAMRIDDISAKVRAHGVKDHVDDIPGPYWAGVIPTRLSYGAPQPAEDLRPGIAAPSYLPRD
jgi:hypothetical protein